MVDICLILHAFVMCSGQLPIQFFKITYKLCEDCASHQRDRQVDKSQSDRPADGIEAVNAVKRNCYQIKYYVLIHKCGPLVEEGHRGSHLIETGDIDSLSQEEIDLQLALEPIGPVELEPLTNSCPGQFCKLNLAQADLLEFGVITTTDSMDRISLMFNEMTLEL